MQCTSCTYFRTPTRVLLIDLDRSHATTVMNNCFIDCGLIVRVTEGRRVDLTVYSDLKRDPTSYHSHRHRTTCTAQRE